MLPETKRLTAEIGGKTIAFETGRLAMQAGGAVLVSLGETSVFAAATMAPTVRQGIDFFPLTVDYEERMYAGGSIPGSYFRREGRPTEEAILIARLTDRPLRPLFPNDLRNDVQVMMYAFSYDSENPLDMLAINAASAAVMISDAPWNGPVAAVRVGRVKGELVALPTHSQLAESDLDLRMAGTKDAILMVECGAKEVPEDVMVQALAFGHDAMQPIIALQEELRLLVGKPKREYQSFATDPALIAQVLEKVAPALNAALDAPHKKAELNEAVKAIEDGLVAELVTPEAEKGLADGARLEAVKAAFEDAYKTVVRERILEQGKRPDGRAYDELRPIWCDVGVLPRPHGTGLFTRGETQVLSFCTLGTPRDAQELEGLSPNKSKRYMHNYNFPPFSTGEVKTLRGQSRREVGHGALAERALLPVIPPEKEFPYTLRVVSEVLSSNGSSSMGSVCGSTLALMDAGVPITAPVAGVAMGLVKEGERTAVLTDIQGLEDHLGDMDFKVAGTRAGITALQMDIKIGGLSKELMSQALEQARIGRLQILEKMLAVLPAPRAELKPHAPRITILHIPVDKIGAVIGPGGKVIRGIQEQTGVTIDIEEDGTVYIASTDGVGAEHATEMVEALTETPIVGRIYTGRVVRVADFGAFVEILPNIDGMVHISQLDSERVNRVEDVVALGDEITVMVTGIDPQGKIRLSRQAVLEGWTPEEAISRDRGPGERGGDRNRSGGGDRNRGGGDRNRSGGDRNRSGGGGNRGGSYSR